MERMTCALVEPLDDLEGKTRVTRGGEKNSKKKINILCGVPVYVKRAIGEKIITRAHPKTEFRKRKYV